jgi:hypothetical protein
MDWSSVGARILPSLLYTGAALYESRRQRKEQKRANLAYEQQLQQQMQLMEGQRFTMEQMRQDLNRRELEAKKKEAEAQAQIDAELAKEQAARAEAKTEATDQEVKRLTRRRSKRSVTTGPSGGMGFFDEYFA